MTLKSKPLLHACSSELRLETHTHNAPCFCQCARYCTILHFFAAEHMWLYILDGREVPLHISVTYTPSTHLFPQSVEQINAGLSINQIHQLKYNTQLYITTVRFMHYRTNIGVEIQFLPYYVFKTTL